MRSKSDEALLQRLQMSSSFEGVHPCASVRMSLACRGTALHTHVPSHSLVLDATAEPSLASM